MDDEKRDIIELNSLLRRVMAMPPLVEFSEPMKEADHEMLQGLAEMFINKGSRKYLQRKVNESLINAALASKSMVDLIKYQTRVIVYKDLLIRAFKASEQYAKRGTPKELADSPDTQSFEA